VLREYSDVRDVVYAYAELMTHPIPNSIFNVASGVAVSLRDVITALESITRHRLSVQVHQKFFRSNEIGCLRGSSSRLRHAVRLPEPRDLQETLSWMLAESEVLGH
jgi:GDP-6-deoxy-D-talose 4-dehydrogenase